MKLTTAISLVLFFGALINSFGDGQKEISELTVDNFKAIKSFIIEQGKRQTYCNMFNNNPHWGFEGFNMYLNPPSQQNINCQIGKSEFNEIVIQTTKPIKYWHVKYDSSLSSIEVIQHHSSAITGELNKQASIFFTEALDQINKKSNQALQPTVKTTRRVR